MNQPESALYKLTDRAKDVIRCAAAAALRAHNTEIGRHELLHALAFNKGGVAAYVLEYVGWMRSDTEDAYTLTGEALDLEGSAFVHRITAAARSDTVRLGHNYPGTEDLLLALVRLYPNVVPDPQATSREVLSVLGHDPA